MTLKLEAAGPTCTCPGRNETNIVAPPKIFFQEGKKESPSLHKVIYNNRALA
jgi:hypothetical protein